MLDKFVFRKNTSDENVIKEILEKKAYSKKKIDFKIESDDVWLDGGSHIGVFGLYAAQNGAKKVYCYEPETENYKYYSAGITTKGCGKSGVNGNQSWKNSRKNEKHWKKRKGLKRKEKS